MARLPVKQEPVFVTVRGQEVDVTKALPLKMGAWNRLRAEGVDPMVMGREAKNQTITSEPMQKIAYHVIILACALQGLGGVTPAELDDQLELADCLAVTTATMKADQAQVPDRPTSTESSASPSGGVGDPVT